MALTTVIVFHLVILYSLIVSIIVMNGIAFNYYYRHKHG